MCQTQQAYSTPMAVEYITLDVETANPDFSSICQIGIAEFVNGEVVGEHSHLVNPEDWFDPVNISIHGITENDVMDSPTYPQLSAKVQKILDGRVCAIHTHFDRSAISRVCDKYQLDYPQCTWLDTARVVRRTWKEFAWKGYGLKNVTQSLGINFRHHDALEDAKAAGKVLWAAIQKTDLDVHGWLKRVEQPIFGATYPEGIKKEGNPDGPLYGECLVFTGTLSVPRGKAVNLAADLGCAVKAGMSKKVTMLVVGDQDVTKLAGHTRSSKHRKALELIENGAPIRIVRETDFLSFLDAAKNG